MRTTIALAVLLLMACETTTHFRVVAVDGFSPCANGTAYSHPLCLEHEGEGTTGTRVVTDPDVTIDLADQPGEWTFRVGRCEHRRDPESTTYTCGECRDRAAAEVRSIAPGAHRRVRVTAPPADCAPMP